MKTETTEQPFSLKHKARCMCGHIGGCENSEHEEQVVLDTALPGHGKCKVEGCSCAQFTWKEWA